MGVIDFSILGASSSSSSGPVNSVNGQTGNVNITANSLGAITTAIIQVTDAATRQAISTPNTKVIYVQDDGMAYIYSGSVWIDITQSIEIVDNLTSTDSNKAVSANQANILNGNDIDSISYDNTTDSIIITKKDSSTINLSLTERTALKIPLNTSPMNNLSGNTIHEGFVSVDTNITSIKEKLNKLEEKNVYVDLTSLQSDTSNHKVGRIYFAKAEQGFYEYDGTNIALVFSSNGSGNSSNLGIYLTLSALQTAHPTATAGDQAYVDAGAGSPMSLYFYDSDDGWVTNGGTSNLTAAEIKTLYEDNADTNAFTDAEKTKLATTVIYYGSFNDYLSISALPTSIEGATALNKSNNAIYYVKSGVWTLANFQEHIINITDADPWGDYLVDILNFQNKTVNIGDKVIVTNLVEGENFLACDVNSLINYTALAQNGESYRFCVGYGNSVTLLKVGQDDWVVLATTDFKANIESAIMWGGGYDITGTIIGMKYPIGTLFIIRNDHTTYSLITADSEWDFSEIEAFGGDDNNIMIPSGSALIVLYEGIKSLRAVALIPPVLSYIQDKLIAGVVVTKSEILYFDEEDSKLKKAIDNGTGKDKLLYIAEQNAALNKKVKVAISGNVDFLSGLTPGMDYALSQTIAGQYEPFSNFASGTSVLRLFTALTDTKAKLYDEPVIVQV